MPKTVFLIRHGAIVADGLRQYIGSTDLSLTETGREQAQRLALVMAARQSQALWVSPMRRTRQTAELVFPGMQPRIIDDLREIDFGRWEQKTFEEIAASDPDLVDQWCDFTMNFAFPEGESLEAFRKRIDAVAKGLREDPAEAIAVVSHGGVIRSLICHFLGLPHQQYLLFDVKLGSVSTVGLFDGGGVLEELSATSADY